MPTHDAVYGLCQACVRIQSVQRLAATGEQMGGAQSVFTIS